MGGQPIPGPPQPHAGARQDGHGTGGVARGSGKGWGPYPQVNDGHGGTVSPAHDAVEVLQAGGEEGAEGAGQPHLPGLLEALEVGAADAAHATAQRRVEGHEVQLPKGTKPA